MNSIESKIKQLNHNINQITKKPVRIVAASKYANVDQILQAHKSGIYDFGENYCQNAILKINKLKTFNLTWHFIGSIQSNKIKTIGENFQWIQSITKIEQIETLNKYHSTKKFNICIQIALNKHEREQACLLQDTEKLLTSINKYKNIQCKGLMYLPPAEISTSKLANSFQIIQDTFFHLQKKFQLDTLSMGMSGDFKIAIANGSNMIRIGKKLFEHD